MTIDPNNLAATAKLTFSDEFNGLSVWNGSTGTWSTNWWYNDEWGNYAKSNGGTLTGNAELQWYINDNYAQTSSVNPWTVSNGVLSITAEKASAAISPLIDNYQYTSGMLNSWHSFSQTYGYFEMNAKLPAGQGLWPAFWLMQVDGDWPPEIDVMEVLGQDVTKLYSTVHTNVTGDHTASYFSASVANMATNFHRYGVNWQADFITFYFDGQQVGKVATPADLQNEPMYMIVNLAVGGHWPGAPNASTPFPATLQVDYIRAYSDVGAAPTISSSTPATSSGSTSGTGSATTGSAAAEQMAGTELKDTILGEAGNDDISGLGGDDYLRGGDGDDTINGGDGFDDVHGNIGADTEHGNAGADWVVGGQGDDLLYGDADNDIVYGNLGADNVNGGVGADTVRGGQGNDVLTGGDGNDWLSGDKGSDTLTGGLGADVFHASSDAGIERILDFSRAQGDRIMLDAGTSYSVQQSGADTVIDLGGGISQMILVGVSASSLQGDWIYLG